jgi:hypothetical protein
MRLIGLVFFLNLASSFSETTVSEEPVQPPLAVEQKSNPPGCAPFIHIEKTVILRDGKFVTLEKTWVFYMLAR